MTSVRTWQILEAQRLAAVTVVGLVVGLALAACGSDDPGAPCAATAADQKRPVGSNGLAYDPTACRGSIWVADLFGGELLRFDPATSVIEERYGASDGLDAPDDLVVTADGRLVSTSPKGGTVSLTERDGKTTVLAHFDPGPNPIALEPGGQAVLVGFEADEPTTLERVPLDGGKVTTIATGLPALNGFAFGPDGLLYAPTGGASGALGGGGIARIDTKTGQWSPITLSFDEAGKKGLDFAAAIAFGPHGEPYALQGIGPRVYRIDTETGAATLVAKLPTTTGDNLVVAPDGTIFVSTFQQPRLFELRPDGSIEARVIGGG